MAEMVKAGVADTQALANLASVCQVTPGEVAKVLISMVMPGASGPELVAFAMVCSELRLSPLKGEIYAFKGQNGQFRAMVGIDGWLTSINRQPQFDGLEIEMEDHPQTGKPRSCTVRLHHKQRKLPVVVTEFYDECRRDTKPWNQHPRRMLRHKTIAQAARIAFGFAGVTDEDDAEMPAVKATAAVRSAAGAAGLNAKVAALPPEIPASPIVEAEVAEEADAEPVIEPAPRLTWGTADDSATVTPGVVSNVVSRKSRTTGNRIVTVELDTGFDTIRASAETEDDLSQFKGRTVTAATRESAGGEVLLALTEH